MKNRLKKISPQFKKILKTVSALADSSGFKIYLIGGVVRDLILNKKLFDLDIVVEGDAIFFAGKLSEALGVEFHRHHSFGTATINFKGHKIDFATARTEKYSHPGVLPKVFPASLAQDLWRRDFSINAMAVSLNRDDYGELVDIYDGLGDLRQGLIRVLHPESFRDDPTRILRAVRFEQRFLFKIEPKTFKLMREALDANALKLVSPHRIRDELILILKEDKPLEYIRRIKDLTGFSFIDKTIELDRAGFGLLSRIEKSALYYRKKFKKPIELWLLYLAAILIKINSLRLSKFFSDFGLRKSEQAVIVSIKREIKRIKSLKKQVKDSSIYRTLRPYSQESILFFYAYYRDNALRKNIERFWDKLSDVRLKISGRDLKEMGLKPDVLYSKILESVLYSKIDKGLSSKDQEIEEVKRILKRRRGRFVYSHREKGLNRLTV